MKLLLALLVFAITLGGVSTSVLALDYTADLSLSLAEQYNDNIYLAHSGRVSDYITLITPSVTLSTRTEKADVRVNYSPTVNLYGKHDENNSTTHQASARGLFRLSEKMDLTVADSFVHSREASVIRAIEGSGPIIQAQQRITTNTLTGDLSYRLSGKTTLLATTAYTITDSSAATGDVAVYLGGLGATYLFNERTTLRANFTYTLYDYKITRDGREQDYTIGANYRITPTITIDGFGGLSITTIEDPDRTTTGPTGGLSVTKTFERGVATLAYRYSVVAGVESGTPVKSQTLTFRYSVPVTSSLDASLSAFYNRYKSVITEGITEATSRDDMGGSVDASYRILPWLSATLSYSYIKSRDKLIDTGSYYNNLVMIGLRAARQARF